MRISPRLLLLSAMVGCGSGTDSGTKSAKTPDEKAPVATTPDAATVKKHMTPAQLALGDPVINSVGMLLVPIPAGTFTMGEGKTAHKVTLTQAFQLGVFEVTQERSYSSISLERPTSVRA